MTATIDNVAVIGAGTMGAAIAAHCANAGLPVLLLDVVPGELTADEQRRGLTLDDPAVKNRVVRDGFERIGKIQPPSFMSARARELVRLGNLDDDLEAAGQAGWIVEAVVEKLEVKRRLMARLDAVRRPGAIVTTNTSGLPISRIAEGLSDGFRRHFFGTHFFNPPRYLRLLETIPGPETDPETLEAFEAFADRVLGKGVVRCKDTPNFIANRIGSFGFGAGLRAMMDLDLTVEEVDALTGPAIGRAKSATFRTADIAGVDVALKVAENLFTAVESDPQREVFKVPAFM
ncbi:MAG TPA: 3-hydroxyacyl-CoA dehydrogenase family protein, partial [Thermoanaerobaculia bacterium]